LYREWPTEFKGCEIRHPAAIRRSGAVFVSPTGGGAFAIGDKNAVVGNHVTFWGAQ
jgi:hypothetical protein